jgi:hypothetical protein
MINPDQARILLVSFPMALWILLKTPMHPAPNLDSLQLMPECQFILF